MAFLFPLFSFILIWQVFCIAVKMCEGRCNMELVQPYFEFATYQYQKKPIMSHGIAQYYHYCRNCQELDKVHAIPDGCVDMYFEKSSSGVQVKACGTVLKSTSLDTQLGNEYFGIRFMPGVLPSNLKVRMEDLVEQELDLEDILTNKNLSRRIEEKSDWRECIRLYVEDYLHSLQSTHFSAEDKNHIRLFEYIKEQIVSNMGNIRVKELAENAGYSARYINMLFRQYIGISPKTFSEIIKFQYAVQLIDAHQEDRLTKIGLDIGYFDQAHFIKEFKKYSMVTPNEYRKMLKKHNALQQIRVC